MGVVMCAADPAQQEANWIYGAFVDHYTS